MVLIYVVDCLAALQYLLELQEYPVRGAVHISRERITWAHRDPAHSRATCLRTEDCIETNADANWRRRVRARRGTRRAQHLGGGSGRQRRARPPLTPFSVSSPTSDADQPTASTTLALIQVATHVLVRCSRRLWKWNQNLLIVSGVWSQE
ncbi:Hypothetical predicted protein [Cloeon dipterum]|uniref:Uncharacterized protein n=1 Tax=Cloeon dipterum TaxID=197152 RepID=A0A8S1DGW2_9INSE|nr:Hypothetical predicted protein [Cloeon dipterum]